MNSGNLKIVCVGGGSGLSHFVKGVKDIPNVNLTCIVTVADDGGSSGILKNELEIPAVGDIRNVLSSLSNAPELMSDILTYRFEKGSLTGHSLGNLLFASLIHTTGSIEGAIEHLSQIFNVSGTIIPSCHGVVDIKATFADGSSIVGESKIGKSFNRIEEIEYTKKVVVNEDAVNAILEADIVVYSIGSLYTSIIPNLIIPEIREAIKCCNATRIYFSNLMSQPGETDDYMLSDYIDAINKHLGFEGVDVVIKNKGDFSLDILNKYLGRGAKPVKYDKENIKNTMVIEYDIAYIKGGHVRHNPKKIHNLLSRDLKCLLQEK